MHTLEQVGWILLSSLALLFGLSLKRGSDSDSLLKSSWYLCMHKELEGGARRGRMATFSSGYKRQTIQKLSLDPVRDRKSRFDDRDEEQIP